MARKRRNYTDELKKKIVELYNSGKPRAELVREYELTPSALSSWINKCNNSVVMDGQVTLYWTILKRTVYNK